MSYHKNAITLTREELYKLVWEKPRTQLANEFGISDVAITKICKKHKIPRPGPGYWTKVEVGKPVDQPQLPAIPNPETIYIHPNPPPSMRSSSVNNENPAIHVPVSANIEDIHPIAKNSYKSFKAGKTGDRQLLTGGRKIHLDLRVTKDTLERSILIMDSLIRIFEELGYEFQLTENHDARMSVTVDNEEMFFHIEERTKQIEYQMTDKEQKKRARGEWFWTPRWSYEPTGELSLWNHGAMGYWVEARQKYADGKRQKVETILGKFVEGLTVTAKAIKARRLELEQQEQERQRKQEERDRLLELRNIEISKREHIEELMARWDKSQTIRNFIESVKHSHSSHIAKQHFDGDLENWVGWAKSYADHIDPLVDSPPTIIEDTNHLGHYIY